MATKEQIIDYIMSTPHNTNWTVLSSMLGEGNWDKLKKYVETTPYNMNKKILEALLGGKQKDNSAVVGTAIVGTAII